MEGRRFDDAAFTALLANIARAYTLVTSFLLAHALGPVFGRTLATRKGCCASCPKCERDAKGHARCKGFPDGDCQCPEWSWWFPSRLAWQRAWRNFVCPLGLFGRFRPTGATDGTLLSVLRRRRLAAFLSELHLHIPAVLYIACECGLVWMAFRLIVSFFGLIVAFVDFLRIS